MRKPLSGRRNVFTVRCATARPAPRSAPAGGAGCRAHPGANAIATTTKTSVLSLKCVLPDKARVQVPGGACTHILAPCQVFPCFVSVQGRDQTLPACGGEGPAGFPAWNECRTRASPGLTESGKQGKEQRQHQHHRRNARTALRSCPHRPSPDGPAPWRPRG